ncbi:MAG: GNAT family N-acetyltransferase [Pseudomonadota bacterium]
MRLTPYAGEPELGDPAFAGEFAAELAKVAGAGAEPPWCTYVARRDGRAAGSGGFKGPPDERGAVEIGYLTFIPMRGAGVATAFAGGLIEIARDNGASQVIAHTLREENPSTRVLLANGFVRTADVEDPEDGPIWRWELPLWLNAPPRPDRS